MGSKKSKLKAGVTNWANQGPVDQSTVRVGPKLLSSFMTWTPCWSDIVRISQWSSDSCKFSIDHTLLKKQEIKELAEKTNFTVEGIFSEYPTKILIQDCHAVRESLIWTADHFWLWSQENSKKEIRTWHSGFLKDCPSGKLYRSEFTKIYVQGNLFQVLAPQIG